MRKLLLAVLLILPGCQMQCQVGKSPTSPAIKKITEGETITVWEVTHDGQVSVIAERFGGGLVVLKTKQAEAQTDQQNPKERDK